MAGFRLHANSCPVADGAPPATCFFVFETSILLAIEEARAWTNLNFIQLCVRR